MAFPFTLQFSLAFASAEEVGGNALTTQNWTMSFNEIKLTLCL